MICQAVSGELKFMLLRMRSQITFDDKETHPQGLPIHQNQKLKMGKPLVAALKLRLIV